jgi:hypothetical protein
MFSNVTIALIFAIGAGGWIFAKLQHQSGNQTKQSLMAAGIGGALLFIVVLLVLNSLFSS